MFTSSSPYAISLQPTPCFPSPASSILHQPLQSRSAALPSTQTKNPARAPARLATHLLAASDLSHHGPAILVYKNIIALGLLPDTPKSVSSSCLSYVSLHRHIFASNKAKALYVTDTNTYKRKKKKKHLKLDLKECQGGCPGILDPCLKDHMSLTGTRSAK